MHVQIYSKYLKNRKTDEFTLIKVNILDSEIFVNLENLCHTFLKLAITKLLGKECLETLKCDHVENLSFWIY